MTFSPSIKVTYRHPKGHTNENPAPLGWAGEYVEEICHSFVIDGRIQFLSDCTHALANQTVDLPDWTELDAPNAAPPHILEELAMSTAAITIAYAEVPGFPPGSAVDHILITLTDAAGTALSSSAPPGAGSATFENLAAGDYTVRAQAMAADNSALGVAASATFNVPAPATVTLSLPSTVSATVS